MTENNDRETGDAHGWPRSLRESQRMTKDLEARGTSCSPI